MSEESPSASRVGGVIPHFYFDVIGRIVPGSYLFVAALITAWNETWFQSIRKEIPQVTALSPTSGFLLSLVLLLGGYLLGFLLGAVSYFIEFLWAKIRPWTWEDLKSWLDVGENALSEKDVIVAKRIKVRKEPIEGLHSRIAQASWLCAYGVWTADVQLGTMAGRWDAEALGSRSTLAVSFVLAIWNISICQLWRAVFFALVGVAAFFAYSYHRRKQVQGRFLLLQSIQSSKLEN